MTVVRFTGGKIANLGGHEFGLPGTTATPVPTPVVTPVPTPTATPLPPPANGATVTTFSLANWGTATSKGFWRQGIVFRDGDVPAGSSVQVQRGGAAIAMQFDERRSFPSGCLAFAVMHGRDADFAVGESRSYQVIYAAGVPFSNASSRTIGNLQADSTYGNYKVKFANLTETDDTQTTAVGSKSFIAYFSEHAGVATRQDKIHSGPVSNGYTCWGMARDVGAAGAGPGVAQDAHLKTIWYVNEWLNADGSLYAHDVAAVVSQDWWSVPGKKRRDYDATFTAGLGTGNPIQSYNAVPHIYNSQWITVQNSGGNNRGRRHWVGGACPTLTYQPDRAYWIASGYVPPLNLTTPRNLLASPGAYNGNATYIPISNQEHRPNIDGTGGYPGRGILTNMDALAFLSQNPSDVAAARIDSMAGLHVFMHHRSNRQRTRPGDSAADTANTIIAWDMTAPGVPAFDFTAQGLPVPVLAAADTRSAPADMDGYVVPTGGRVYWDTSYGDGAPGGNSRSDDASHSVPYSYFLYLLEGERYHLETTLDLAQHTLHQSLNNGIHPPLFSQMSGPQWNAVAQVATDEERNTGWAQARIGDAASVVPDGHVANGYFKRLVQQQGLYFQATLNGLSPDMKLSGVHPWTDANGIVTPWEMTFNPLACYRTWKLTGDLGAKAWADHLAQWSINNVRERIFATGDYRSCNKLATAPGDIRTNPYHILSLDVDTPTVSIAAATGLLTVSHGSYVADAGLTYYVASRAYNTATTVVPSELVPGTPYYVRDLTPASGNSDGSTFRLSLTRGGPAITFRSDYPEVHFLRDADPGGLNPDLPYGYVGADDYPPQHRAVLVEAYRAGHPMATGALVQRAQHYCSGTTAGDLAGWATWDYAVPATEWGGTAAATTPPGAVANLRTTYVAADMVWLAWDMPTGRGQQPTFKVENSGDGGQTWATAAASTPLLGCGIVGLVSVPRSQMVRVTAFNEAGVGSAATLAVTLKASAGGGPGPYTYTVAEGFTTHSYPANIVISGHCSCFVLTASNEAPSDTVYFRWSQSATDPSQRGGGPGPQAASTFTTGQGVVQFSFNMPTAPAGTWYLWVTVDGEGCAKQVGTYTFT